MGKYKIILVLVIAGSAMLGYQNCSQNHSFSAADFTSDYSSTLEQMEEAERIEASPGDIGDSPLLVQFIESDEEPQIGDGGLQSDIDNSGDSGAQGDGEGDGGASPTNALSKSIPVVQNKSKNPYKMIIVVDPSFSMKRAQAQIAHNIDSLLKPLSGIDVDIIVVSAFDRARSVLKMTKQNGSPATSADMKSKSAGPISVVEYFLPEQKTIYSLRSDDDQATLDQKIADVKARINGFGENNGASGIETPFCTLMRYAEDFRTESFVKQGDNLSVVVISDEDDNSNPDNCDLSHTYSYKNAKASGPMKTTMVFEQTTRRFYVRYKYIASRKTKFTYSQDTVRDGFVMDGNSVTHNKGSWVTRGKAYNFRAAGISEASIRSAKTGNCPASMVAKVLRHLKSGGNTTMKIEKCQITVGRPTKKTIVTFEKDKNYCTESIDRKQSLREVAEHPQGGYLMENCRKLSSYTPKPKTQRIKTTPRKKSIISGSARSRGISDRFAAAVVSSFKNKTDNDLSMSFIINPTAGDCDEMIKASTKGYKTTDEYDPLGEVFEHVEELHAQQTQVLPVCADSYEQGLSFEAAYIEKVALAEKYALDLEPSATIEGIVIVRGSQEFPLSHSDYKVSEGMLTVNRDLAAGDEIKVLYQP